MTQNRKNADLVEPSIMSTDAHEPRNEKDTKNAKLASKPKVEGGILGDDRNYRSYSISTIID